MGKRSDGDFERNPRDYYPTPYEAVEPLLPRLGVHDITFAEPCAGDGRLIRHLERMGHKCLYACDIEPKAEGIFTRDALTFSPENLFYAGPMPEVDYIITNPPWERKDDGGPLHEMIRVFSKIAPTWLLFDADWMHTVQAAPFRGICREIVSVGRVKWIEGTKNSGMDNCAWYLFDAEDYRYEYGPTRFYFRDAA